MRLIRKLALLTTAVLMTVSVSCVPAMASDNAKIKLGYVQSWPSSSLTTKLAAQAIENNLSNKVQLVALTAGPLYQAVASGDLDGMLTSWLPKTHASYYKKLWPKVINLGPNLIGTRLGMVVPKYVKADSIADLKGQEGKFNHQVIGVGSGAGININTKKAIKAYGLNMHLTASSTAAMAATLKRDTRLKKPVVVTGWSPLWIWSKFDLKYLKDPKNIYGRSGYVETLVNPSLPKKAPRVFSFLNRFYIKLSALNKMEAATQAGKSDKEVVNDWLSSHPKTVKSWFAPSG